MCTAVLTHFLIYTQTCSRVIHVYAPRDLPQALHTLPYMIYTHICMYEYIYIYIYRYLGIDCTCIFTCSMAGTGILPKMCPSWTCNLSYCVAGTAVVTSIQLQLPACVVPLFH